MQQPQIPTGSMTEKELMKQPPPGMREERIIDDDGNDIVIRFSGEVGSMYDFLSAYIGFRQARRGKHGTPPAVESEDSA